MRPSDLPRLPQRQQLTPSFLAGTPFDFLLAEGPRSLIFMRRVPAYVTALSIATVAASSLTWASSAQAKEGLTASLEFGAVTVQGHGMLPPGDVVIDGTSTSVDIYLDPDIPSTLPLTAGPGCRAVGSRALTCDGKIDSIRIELWTISYSGTPVVFAVTENTPIETRFYGSPFADEFYGGPGSDWIRPGWGNDVIFGGAGDDWIFGGAGADVLDGEGGEDVVFGDAGPDTITADEDGGAVDLVNCNNFHSRDVGTNNDPANPPTNSVTFDRGLDRVTDCGVAGAPGVTKAPAFTGVPTVGRNYTPSAGAWTGRGLTMSFAWFSCPRANDWVPFTDVDVPGRCTKVLARDGVSGLTYKPTASDRGNFLKLRSTARNNAGFWTVISDASPAVVTPKR